ncbi:MAG: AAA family ATPase, partial [Thermogutta sp.]|nr:AAA family ATPase [Thermogutta sp.]
MNAAIERILQALEAAGCDPKPCGEGKWQSLCPSHELDGQKHHPSLSIGVGADGRVLLTCFGGCPVVRICDALGMKAADLFDAEKPRPGRKPGSNGKPKGGNGKPGGGDENHKAPGDEGKAYPTAAEAIRALEQRFGKRANLWTYCDKDGKPVGVVLRWNRPDGSKEIRPVAKDGEGRWRITGLAKPRVLYRLPDLLEADLRIPVVVTEGEKCCDAAMECGLLCTTSAGGANAARLSDWLPVKGRPVVVLPDHDAAGEKYGEDVAVLCHAAGAASVKVLRLADHAPGLPEGGDLADIVESSDWCGLPLPKDARPEDVGKWLLAEAESLPEWKRDPATEPGPVVVRLADIERKDIEWLWPGRVPMGCVTLISGRPGCGKSFLTLDMAARISTGTPWPDGETCERGEVLILSAEDDPASVIRPRLEGMYADLSRIHLLQAVRRADADGKMRERPVMLEDVEAVEEALERLPDCRLLVVDPIGSFIGSKTDTFRDNEVRSILGPLAALASGRGVAVVLVAHHRKAGASAADDLAMGSRAFTGVARASWHVLKDRENRARRLFLPGKCNLSAEPDGLAFAIAGVRPTLLWEHEPVSKTADDVAAEESQGSRGKRGPEPETRNRATEWLAQLLANGPLEAESIKEEAKLAGFTWRTIHRAKDE